MNSEQITSLKPMRDGELELILNAFHAADDAQGLAAFYEFNMALTALKTVAGRIRLRLGDTADLVLYHGQIGYNVYPEFRGQRLAGRSLKLLLPLAAQHQINPLWITCDPDNIASRKTCERVGAELVEIIDVPPTEEIYHEGERRKCRYRLLIQK